MLGSARVESAVVRPPGPRGTEARSPSLLVAGALLRRLLAKKTLLAPSGGHRAARATTRGHCGARSPRTLRARRRRWLPVGVGRMDQGQNPVDRSKKGQVLRWTSFDSISAVSLCFFALLCWLKASDGDDGGRQQPPPPPPQLQLQPQPSYNHNQHYYTRRCHHHHHNTTQQLWQTWRSSASNSCASARTSST